MAIQGRSYSFRQIGPRPPTVLGYLPLAPPLVVKYRAAGKVRLRASIPHGELGADTFGLGTGGPKPARVTSVIPLAPSLKLSYRMAVQAAIKQSAPHGWLNTDSSGLGTGGARPPGVVGEVIPPGAGTARTLPLMGAGS